MATASAHATPVDKTIEVLRRHIWIWLGVGGIAAAIDWLLRQESEQGGIGQTLWLVVVFTAAVWAARKLSNNRSEPPSVKDVFYEGSAAFLKQLLVVMFWIVCLLPLMAGSFVFSLINSPLFAATGLEMAGAFVGWLLLAAVSLFWITRTIFAPVLVGKQRPSQAIRFSWRMTKRRAGRLALHAYGWLLITLIPTIAIYYVTLGGLIQQPAIVSVLQVVANALIFLLVLPFISVLIYQLYAYETRTARRR